MRPQPDLTPEVWGPDGADIQHVIKPRTTGTGLRGFRAPNPLDWNAANGLKNNRIFRIFP